MGYVYTTYVAHWTDCPPLTSVIPTRFELATYISRSKNPRLKGGNNPGTFPFNSHSCPSNTMSEQRVIGGFMVEIFSLCFDY